MQQENKNLRQAILKTIAFFDIFKYPLTAQEIWRYLYYPGGAAVDYTDVLSALKYLEPENKIQYAQGFYFLSSDVDIVRLRKKKFLIAEPKLKKVKKYTKYLSVFKFIRGVAVSNTLALHNSRREADIDIFIITRHGKIWCARFFSLLPLEILRQRPSPGKTQDRFCFSYYVDDKNLNIESWKNKHDIYYIYWLATLLPVYDDGVFKNFWEQNQWIMNYLPNLTPGSTSKRLSCRPLLRCSVFCPEHFIKSLQYKFMPPKLRQAAQRETSDVVLADGVIKLHLQDRRRDFQNQFDRKLYQLGA